MTGQEPDQDAVNIALREAIEGTLARFGEFPTRWVLAAETVGQDNERALWLATAEGARPWDTIGLAGFLIERERAGIHRALNQKPDD